jgi:hypothetical protein
MWIAIIVLALLLYGKFGWLGPIGLLLVIFAIFHVRNLYRRRYM